MKLKSVIMDEAAVQRSMMRVTHEIIEKNSGTEDLVLLGIRRRGVILAGMLRLSGAEVSFSELSEPELFRAESSELSVVCPVLTDSCCVVPSA